MSNPLIDLADVERAVSAARTYSDIKSIRAQTHASIARWAGQCDPIYQSLDDAAEALHRYKLRRFWPDGFDDDPTLDDPDLRLHRLIHFAADMAQRIEKRFRVSALEDRPFLEALLRHAADTLLGEESEEIRAADQ